MNYARDERTICRIDLWMRMRVLPILIVAISMIAVAPAWADEARLATPTELRQMRDAGQYRICLQQIARTLRVANPGKNYDRYDLLLLKADCLLHLDDVPTAQLVYAAVSKSPVTEQAREGRAMVLLLQRYTKMAYLPRSDDGAGAGIDLVSQEGRTKALGALLQDELRASESDFGRALNANNLIPIRDALPKLADLYAIERTLNVGDSKLRPTLDAIGRRARTLIDRELDLCEQSITSLERRANQAVDVPAAGWWWGRSVRRGLYSRDRRKLRDLIDYLQRVEETVGLGQQLAVSFDDEANLWDPLFARASKSVRHAQDVLDAE